MPAANSVTPVLQGASARGTNAGFHVFGADGFNFRDVLDVINPLHHIPVVGDIYRKLSGDAIAPALRVAGGALFGGPLGAAFAAAGVVMRAAVDDFNGEPALPVESPLPQHAPGGWMVASTRSFDRSPAPPQTDVQIAELSEHPEAAPVARRRGGWMVEAAYAMADARAEQALRSRGVRTVA